MEKCCAKQPNYGINIQLEGHLKAKMAFPVEYLTLCLWISYVEKAKEFAEEKAEQAKEMAGKAVEWAKEKKPEKWMTLDEKLDKLDKKLDTLISEKAEAKK